MLAMAHLARRFASERAPAPPLVAGLLLLALLLAAIPALAQNIPVTDDEVNAVARRLYCPVCENIPLDACGPPACIQWRAEIRAQLEAGRTPEQVITDFVQRFGERVVGTPQDPMLRALSLVTPWLLAAVALVVAGTTVYRWRRRGEAAQTASPTPPASHRDDAYYRERLEADLRARR